MHAPGHYDYRRDRHSKRAKVDTSLGRAGIQSGIQDVMMSRMSGVTNTLQEPATSHKRVIYH